jgi:hypothetical protein
VFYLIEQALGWRRKLMVKKDIEILIMGEEVLFSWNDEEIQEMAESVGEPEFGEPRPCG